MWESILDSAIIRLMNVLAYPLMSSVLVRIILILRVGTQLLDIGHAVVHIEIFVSLNLQRILLCVPRHKHIRRILYGSSTVIVTSGTFQSVVSCMTADPCILLGYAYHTTYTSSGGSNEIYLPCYLSAQYILYI